MSNNEPPHALRKTLPPIDPIALLRESDERIGLELMAYWICNHAEIRGLPVPPPDEFAQALVRASIDLDTDERKHIPLAKALSVTARGDPQRGGKIFRQILIEGAWEKHLEQLAQTGIKFKVRQKGNASKGARQRAETSEKARAEWLRIGQPLRAKHPSWSNQMLAQKIAAQSGGSASTIRQILPSLGLAKKKT